MGGYRKDKRTRGRNIMDVRFGTEDWDREYLGSTPALFARVGAFPRRFSIPVAYHTPRHPSAFKFLSGVGFIDSLWVCIRQRQNLSQKDIQLVGDYWTTFSFRRLVLLSRMILHVFNTFYLEYVAGACVLKVILQKFVKSSLISRNFCICAQQKQ